MQDLTARYLSHRRFRILRAVMIISGLLMTLAGMNLTDLRNRYHAELFENYLPFWDKFGVDHEYGGFMCSLDYDGARANTDKFLWFQGRGIWIYSFLHNHFGKDAKYLDIARKTKDFVLTHAPQTDGWWAEEFARDGSVKKRFTGDIFGMYFVAEGLQEYAWAMQDDKVREMAFALVKKLFRYMDRPDFRFMGTGDPGVRAQGLWMVNVRIATQMLRRWKDPEIATIADKCVDAVIDRHYNPEIGLNNEMLNFDFSRPKGEETKSLLGHSIETLWMIQDEADRGTISSSGTPAPSGFTAISKLAGTTSSAVSPSGSTSTRAVSSGRPSVPSEPISSFASPANTST